MFNIIKIKYAKIFIKMYIYITFIHLYINLTRIILIFYKHFFDNYFIATIILII